MDLTLLEQQVTESIQELLSVARMPEGSIFVLGCSSSEVCGGRIGKTSNEEVGRVIVASIAQVLAQQKIHLAVQGCEHINRALVIEREIALKCGFEIVMAIPALHAGGACALAAYRIMQDPVLIEHVSAQAGLDIGDTFIGMHIKHVAVPVRLKLKEIGAAHVTAAISRPKLIGGERAVYK